MFNFVMSARKREIMRLFFLFFRIEDFPEVRNTEDSISILEGSLQRLQIIIISLNHDNSSFDECLGLLGSGVPGHSRNRTQI
jgi:hypothetical protein